MRAVKNVTHDGCVVLDAGATEVAVAESLIKYNPSVKGRVQLGVQALADVLLIDRKSTRLNSSHSAKSRMPSSA